MKAILIDDLMEHQYTRSCEAVTVDGIIMEGWQIAKPLNYDKKYTSLWDRIQMAIAVLFGKAIAVQYFTDLSERKKSEFVKSKLAH